MNPRSVKKMSCNDEQSLVPWGHVKGGSLWPNSLTTSQLMYLISCTPFSFNSSFSFTFHCPILSFYQLLPVLLVIQASHFILNYAMNNCKSCKKAESGPVSSIFGSRAQLSSEHPSCLNTVSWLTTFEQPFSKWYCASFSSTQIPFLIAY